MLPPNSSNGSHSTPRPTKDEIVQRENAQRARDNRAQTERDKTGCPMGCGCSGFLFALVLWAPALFVAHAGGVGAAAIGITLLVSLFVNAFLFLTARLSLSGVAEENKKAHLKPHLLFLASYLITFFVLLITTFFVSRAHS